MVVLVIHRGSRADHLVEEVARVLSAPAGDVFDDEWIAVHSRGVERWISQQVSHHLGAGPDGDGVAAGLAFPFPRTVVDRVVAAALGDPEPGPDPWSAASLAFTLLDVVDRGLVDLSTLGAFGVHLQGSRFRRLPALRHAAELLDDYQQHRPDMVMDWLDADQGDPLPDGRGGTLPSRLRWQAILLRSAREVLGETRAERMARAVDALRAGQGSLPGVPRRILLFSLTALAAGHLRVLEALAGRLDVHAFVLHPSPAAWQAGAAALAAPDATAGRRPLRDGFALPEVSNPLLARWGRDSRELQVVLGGRGRDRPIADEASPPANLLERIQADVRADRAPGTDDRGEADLWRLDPDDRSLQAHAAHGQLRQVEVARDAILAALADDPTLEPRDVVVMTPDVEAYAPLVDAAFRAATGPASGLPDLRVRLADRALRTANPLLSAIADLLDLADSRLEAGPVLELLRREPVRRRFDLSEDDVEQLDRWVVDAGVRWGLDADHRARFRLPTDVNTWRFGLDRLLAGIAIESGSIADQVLASDLAADRPALAGRLAEFVARVDHLVARMVGTDPEANADSEATADPDPTADFVATSGPEVIDRDPDATGPEDRPAPGVADPGRAIVDWIEILRLAADLLTDVDDQSGWQRWQFDRVLADLSDRGGDVPATVTLRELRTLLAGELGGRPTRANHQTGDLTVCTLVPMRSVPFRVVVVLGLDDGAFPRHRIPSGDDVLGLAPLVGDRDPRTEDRQLLLDALLSARDRFVVTYRGANERTNQEVPPSVVVSELLDVVSQTARTADGADATAAVHVRHTLRAADPRNFDGTGAGRGWDRVALEGARAAVADPTTSPRLSDRPPVDVTPAPDVLTLARLNTILRNPTRSWLQHVMGFRDHDWADARDDNLAVEATGLQGWSLGEALLQGLRAGQEPTERLRVLRRRGALPVGRLAEKAVMERLPMAVTIARAVTELTEGLADPIGDADLELDVDLDLGGINLRGRVGVPRTGIDVRATYSSAKAGHLLGAWIPHLVRSSLGHPTHLVTVAKYSDRAISKAAVSHVLAPLDPADARRQLADLVAVASRVLVHPVPLFANTSGAYWRARTDGKDDAGSLAASASSWSAGFRTKWGEGHDPNVVRVFGDGPLASLVDAGAVELPDSPPWWEEEPHELARWARRVYDPVYLVSQVSHHPRAEVEPVEVPS